MLEDLQRPPPMSISNGEVFVPLNKKLERYRFKYTERSHEDPLGVKRGVDKLLMNQFNFYGAYVSLSNQDKTEVVADKSVMYLKQTVMDLIETNQQMAIEVEATKYLLKHEKTEVQNLKDYIVPLEN
jgi:hypothetical protein